MSGEEKTAAPVVGIDLGTTHSLIGRVEKGRVHLFEDEQGHVLLPSVVGMAGEHVLVGRTARNRRLLDPEHTIVSVKRSMGTDRTFSLGARHVTATEVSALLLASLLDRVPGVRPSRAVITVPAYFDEVQRQATVDAGELAGLHIERLVNEPTAAALTYEGTHEELVLVYDFGGGTFDVSVLERDDGFMEVRASHGDTALGGDDLDARLLSDVLRRLGPSDAARVRAEPRAMARLTEAVERCKIALTKHDGAELVEPLLAGSGAQTVNLSLTVTRGELEALAAPLVERTLSSIDAAMRRAEVTPQDLDRVLLVGGSSRVPLVARRVAAHLGRPVHVDEDADRAVALGAAKLAGRLSGEDVDEVLVDVTPHRLVVGALSERMDELAAIAVIDAGAAIPTTRSQTFFTQYPNQPAVEVPIAQGDSELFDECRYLGVLEVSGLPPSPIASPVDVELSLDLSGVLQVRATHRRSGAAAEVQVAHGPTRMSRRQRKQAAELHQRLREGSGHPGSPAPAGDRPASDRPASERLARSLLQRAKRALEGGTESPELERVRQAAAALDAACDEGQPTEDLVEALTDALFDLT